MKDLAKKVIAVIGNNRGESLLEGIISIFVFSTLMVAVALLIMLSFSITSNATEMANVRQNEANEALAGRSAVTDAGTIEFEIDGNTINFDITIFQTGSFIAFEPVT